MVSEQALRDLVREYKATHGYQQQIQVRMRASYGSHYRRMVPRILEVLEFRSNNNTHRPLIDTLALLRRYAESSQQYYPPGKSVPITEAILQRFTRNNLQHPTYQALAELGKAVKTIFLCRYLRSEALRREMHEGFTLIEDWNSANGFIFYGRSREFSTDS